VKQNKGSNGTATRQMWTEWLPVTPSSGSENVYILHILYGLSFLLLIPPRSLCFGLGLVVFLQDY